MKATANLLAGSGDGPPKPKKWQDVYGQGGDVKRAIRRQIRRVTTRVRRDRQRASQDLHNYWRSPDDGVNRPEGYASAGPERGEHLVQLFTKADIPHEATVLEVGCNVGRNLNHLAGRGWEHVAGIDISQQAIEMAPRRFPRLDSAALTCGSLEDVLPAVPDRGFDVVFAMAVLEHVHRDSEHVLDEVARVAGRWLVTVEDEVLASERHFPRNYRKEFERRGWCQTFRAEPDMLYYAFVSRVFTRPAGSG